MQGCPARERLQRLLARQVEGAEAAALERHVEECARCQQLLEELTRTGDVDAWRQLCAAPPEPEPSPGEDFLQKLRESRPARDAGPSTDAKRD
jgi:hypothetical protein